MANSMTFYSPDLSPFVRRLRGAGVAVFGAKYAKELSTASGCGTDASGPDCVDATLYSASVVVPTEPV